MAQNEGIQNFQFESRQEYDQAKREAELIAKLRQEMDVSEPHNALKLYNRAVSEKRFSTVVGYQFLMELRETIIASELAAASALNDIPVRAGQRKRTDVMPERPGNDGKFQKLYEQQKRTGKKLKITVAALVILLAGFVFINFRFEYSIFTYFTNYKANMEEELIDKYEHWQSELEEREKQLEKQEPTATEQPKQ